MNEIIYNYSKYKVYLYAIYLARANDRPEIKQKSS